MSVDPLAFLLESDSEGPSEMSQRDYQGDPLSFLQEKQSPFRKPLRRAAQYGIGLSERAFIPLDVAAQSLSSKKSVMGQYRQNLFEDIERLYEKKSMGDWDEQDEELLNHLISQAEHPEETEKFIKPVDISSGKTIERLGQLAGVDLEPEDMSERGARIGGNILTPKSIVKGVSFGKKMLDPEFRKAYKLQKQWKSLEKSAELSPEKRQMLDIAKDKGLTPEEASVLMKSDWSIENLGKFASKNKRLRNIVFSIKKKLGQSYQELKKIGREGGHITVEEADSLSNNLSKISEDLGRTFVEGPDTKSARIAIDDAINKIQNKGGTVEDLINSRQNLKKGINWKNIDQGDAYLMQADRAFLEAIYRKNPVIGAKLQETDRAWAQYSKYRDILKKKQAKFKILGFEIPDGPAGLAFAAIADVAGLGGKAIGGISTLYALRKISARLLTDPKLSNIHKKLLNGIQDGSIKQQKQAVLMLNKYLKENDPDLYKEIGNIEID